MGELHDLKDKVEGTADEAIGKAEGGVKGGLRVLKGKTKKEAADARIEARDETYREEVTE